MISRSCTAATARRPTCRTCRSRRRESESQWTRLVIHGTTPGRTADIATVDFSAHGVQDGAEVVLHENAAFERENGTWTYTRALREGPAPVRHAGPKPGRNDPCPCGSGKKYKQCCLGRA